jgi:hypothetical protein
MPLGLARIDTPRKNLALVLQIGPSIMGRRP